MYCKCGNRVYCYDSDCEQDVDEVIHTYFFHCDKCGRYWNHFEKYVMVDYWDEEMEND